MSKRMFADDAGPAAAGWSSTIAELIEQGPPEAAGFWRVVAGLFQAPGADGTDPLPDGRRPTGLYCTPLPEWTPEGQAARATVAREQAFLAVAQRPDLLAAALGAAAEGRYAERLADFAEHASRFAAGLSSKQELAFRALIGEAVSAGLVAAVPFLRQLEPAQRTGRKMTRTGKPNPGQAPRSERRARLIRAMAAELPPEPGELLAASYYPRLAAALIERHGGRWSARKIGSVLHLAGRRRRS